MKINRNINFCSCALNPGLLADLRAAALTTDWQSAIAEVLGGADVLPEVCRCDFVEEGKRVAE